MAINKTSSLKAISLSVYDESDFGGDNLITFDTLCTCITIIPSTAAALEVQFDGDEDSVFTIASGQAFKTNAGDIQFQSVDFSNVSGTNIDVQVIVGLGN